MRSPERTTKGKLTQLLAVVQQVKPFFSTEPQGANFGLKVNQSTGVCVQGEGINDLQTQILEKTTLSRRILMREKLRW